jgi:cob(I)alamin adenosyltransferase
MKVYTRTGDKGETGLPGGARVAKDIALLEFCSSVDELNTTLGAARAQHLPPDMDELLERIQHDLFALGAETARRGAEPAGAPAITPERVERFEQAIDRFDEELPPLRNFILPGGTAAAAALHVARATCRRAERRLVTLAREASPPPSPQLLAYLNRLADLLFTMARAANARAGCPDVIWRKDG